MQQGPVGRPSFQMRCRCRGAARLLLRTQRIPLQVEHLRAIGLRHSHVADQGGWEACPVSVYATLSLLHFSRLRHVPKLIFFFVP